MISVSRKYAAAAALGTLATGLGVVTTAAPASASVDECTNGRNGFISIPYNQGGTTKRHIYLGPNDKTLVSLELQTFNGTQRAFAKIQPRQVTGGLTRVGDQVWLDWSTTGSNGWLQCGPWYVRSANSSNTSAAQRLDASTQWIFRACGLTTDGRSGCTGWWHQSMG